MIIGLSGFARSGKDEFAKVAVEEFGFKRIAFADKLREFLYALNPIVMGEWDKNVGMAYARVSQVIDYFGWDGYKESDYGPEIRTLLQRLGTEAGRQTLWDTIWIDAALGECHLDVNYVVSDARFLNEFEAITRRRGTIVRVEREGVGPANDHASEMEALTYDFPIVIENNGTLDEYHQAVRGFLKGFMHASRI